MLSSEIALVGTVGILGMVVGLESVTSAVNSELNDFASEIEASHRLMRFDPRWSALGQSLKSRGKPACVTANRWVRWLYHQLLPLAV